jgi:DNA modification methylase
MKTDVINIEISTVEPHPEVYKTYLPKNLHGLKTTMDKFGQVDPIKVVQRGEKYLIFDGISRYKAALELNWERIKVEVFDLTEQDVLDQAVLRSIKTKKSLKELCNLAELFLGILGSSQGKVRETLGDITAPDDYYGLAGKDRYEIACELTGSDFSASTLRKLIKVKEFEDNGDENVKKLGLMDKLDSGQMKPNQAFNLMSSYQQGNDEQDKNALTDALDFVEGNRFKLYNKTCEDLSDVPDDSVSLCLMSNPYYKQRNYPDGTKPPDVIPHGQEPTVEEYVKKQVEVCRGMKPKLKDTGSLVIVMADSYDGKHLRVTHKFIDAMVEDGWAFIDEWIWKKTNPKPNGGSTAGNRRLQTTFEKILHFAKDEDKYYFRDFKNWLEGEGFGVAKGRAKDKADGKKGYGWSLTRPHERFRNFLDDQQVAKVIETNVFHWSEFNEVDPKFRHLAPYPAVIPILPILMLSPIDSVILDCYSGTSTTAAVALELGRSAIGYDTDKESIRFSKKRLELVEQNLPTMDEVKQLEDDYLSEAA